MDFDPDAWFTSPRKGRAVRGKSDIAELQLVGGVSGPGSAGVDRRRFIDGGDWSTREQELADEFGQPERKHRYAVCPRGNAQQQIGNHGSQNLQSDRVVVGAEELANVEMLLDPAEQQFDLPAAFVEGCDLDGRAGKIVGEKCNHAAGLAPELDP